MRGTYFLGNGAFETRDIPEHPLAPREVLIQVAACGVCGTDVHIYHGDKGSAEVIPPVVLGHELSGTVAAVGAAVKTLHVGDHVAVDPNCYCGECHYCRRGKKQLCTNLHAIGVNENGGFADFCYAPEAQCFLLDPELPLEYGAMAEPLACCLHGIDRAQIRTGDTVLVIGGGAIGLLMVQLAKLSGASQVLLSEPVQTRREIGLQLGANAAIDPIHEDLTARIRALTGMDGVDVVIECVGNTIATAQALSATKRGTTVLLDASAQPRGCLPEGADNRRLDHQSGHAPARRRPDQQRPHPACPHPHAPLPDRAPQGCHPDADVLRIS